MKSAIMTIAAALLLLGCANHVSAAVTTGLRIAGYQYVSDVTGYFNMTEDYCDIQAAIGVNNTEAIDIFMNGKNSDRGATKRSFQLWSITNSSGELSYNAIHAELPADYFTTLFQMAVNANDTSAAMMAIDAVKIKYMLHEVDATVSNTALNRSNDNSGGPHNLDEAASIWSSYVAGSECKDTLDVMAADLAITMGTEYDGKGLVNVAISRAFNDALYAARNNKTSIAEAARLDIHRQVIVFLSQYISEKAAAETLCNGVLTVSPKASADAAMQILVPLLNIQAVPAEYIDTLHACMDAPAQTFSTMVDAAIGAILRSTGIAEFALGSAKAAHIADKYCPERAPECRK